MMLLQGLILSLSVFSALPPAQTKIDEFVFCNDAEPESIDPHVASGVPDNTIIVQLFEGLMARKADWVSLVPGQAESYKVSKDRKTYTFKLRKNLKWSDGSPLTAEDFLYSWLRSMKPSTLGPYSYWLTDHVVGAAEYAKSSTEANLKKVGLKVIDARTFEVSLNKAVPYFLQLTAESPLYPVKKATVEKFGTRWTRPENIVSNGAYSLKTWIIQQKMVMEKNPHYYGANSVSLKRVVAYPIDDRQTAVNLFRQGKLDWSGKNGAPNGLVPAFRKDPNFRVAPGFITYYYKFNTTRAPLNDKRVRQALSLAINRKILVSKVTRGGETAVGYFVPPHTGKYLSPAGIVQDDHVKNLAKARKLLAEAGYPGGKGMRKLTLQYNTDENHKRVALAIQQMWKKGLGIEVQPYNQEWKVYLKAQKSLDYDISRSGWSGDYPDPATFLEMYTTSSENNQTGWKSAAYDKHFYKANGMKDGEARNKEMRAAEAILLEESPIAPIYNYVNFGFLRPEVVGFEQNLVDRPFVRYFTKKKIKK